MKNSISDKIKEIEKEFAYQSGRWAENECIQDEITLEELIYITNKCDELNFEYNIDWKWVKNTAEEYDEELISLEDIINKNVTSENYWQFDFLASDIKTDLIIYLEKQL